MLKGTYNVGILGATGAVGQNYALLLDGHPNFRITYLAASPGNKGTKFSKAVESKWFMDKQIPKDLASLVLGDANEVEDAKDKCDFVFSSYEGDESKVQEKEMEYAKAGIPVISNNSAHRKTIDVPMFIPEINYDHSNLIDVQRKNRGFTTGFVVTKPNCSIQSFLTPIYALIKKGYVPKDILVTTEQALSGAGYPGVSSLDITDNIIPWIKNEEKKTEQEPLKIFGKLTDSSISLLDNLRISATCTRVNVRDGHTASVSISFEGKKPELEEIINIWNNFRSYPQEKNLPFAPTRPIIYLDDSDRPQPRKDRYNGKGMAVTVGRLRDCPVLDIKFVGLSHNTIRGAAGGAILTAEMLAEQGYL